MRWKMILTAVIEMPMGSLWKYEKDDKYGLKVDRPLNQPVPYNYGYCPNTLEEDGDPIDIFLLTDTPIYPLTKVDVELVGVIKCIDNGKQDNKLIAIVCGDCRGYNTMGVGIIKHYLESYKTGFEVTGEGDVTEAIKTYEDSVKMFEDKYRLPFIG
jgi:inorganic pyrophosphatase